MPCSSARSCSSDFGASSGVGGRRGEPQQDVAPIDVQPDVRTAPAAPVPPVPRVHGIGAREKYSASPRRSRDDLDDVRVRELVADRERPAERCVISSDGSASSGCDDGVDRRGLDERLVALDVDDDVAGQLARDFGDAVGAACGGRRASSPRRRRTPRPRRAMRSSSVATITRVARRAPPRRGDRRARSSDGRRCRRELFRGSGWSGIGRG